MKVKESKTRIRKDFVQTWILLLRIMQSGKATTGSITEGLTGYAESLRVGLTSPNVISILETLKKLELVNCRSENVKQEGGGSYVLYYWTLTCQGEEVLGNIQAIFAGSYNPEPRYIIGEQLKGSPRLIFGVGRMLVLAALDLGSLRAAQLRQILGQVIVEVPNDDEMRRRYLKPMREQGYVAMKDGITTLTEAGKQRAAFLRSALGMDESHNLDVNWRPLAELQLQQHVVSEVSVELQPEKIETLQESEVVLQPQPLKLPTFTPAQLVVAAANYTSMGLLQSLLLLLVVGRGSSLGAFAEKVFPRDNDSFGKIRVQVESLQKLGYLDAEHQLTAAGLRLLDLVSLAVAPQLIAIPEVNNLSNELRRAIRRLAIIKVIDLGYTELAAPQVIAALFESAEEGDNAIQSIGWMRGENGRSWLTKEPVAVSLVGEGVLKFWRSLLPVEHISCEELRNLEAVEFVELTTVEAAAENSDGQQVCGGEDEFWSDPPASKQELTAADIAQSFLSI